MVRNECREYKRCVIFTAKNAHKFNEGIFGASEYLARMWDLDVRQTIEDLISARRPLVMNGKKNGKKQRGKR